MYVDSWKYRGLLRLCGVMRWPAALMYAPRGDEQSGRGPRQGHMTAEDTPRRNRSRIDEGMHDLGVTVTALVQRAACECRDA